MKKKIYNSKERIKKENDFFSKKEKTKMLEKPISFYSIKISLVSPEFLKKKIERNFLNKKSIGEIKNSQTLNYKTLKPEFGGLFCERIFGPIKDFECSCGIKNKRNGFCRECGVEYTFSKIRRTRFGFIKLTNPVTHVWFLKGKPSFLSVFLNMSRKKIDSITYCAVFGQIGEKKNIFFKKNIFSLSSFKKKEKKKRVHNFVLSIEDSFWESRDNWQSFVTFFSGIKKKKDNTIKYFLTKKKLFYFRQKSSAEILYQLILGQNLDFMYKQFVKRLVQLQFYLKKILFERQKLQKQEYNLQKKKKLLNRQLNFSLVTKTKKTRQLKIIRNFRQTKTRPEWMFLVILPVLPPPLRPILQLNETQFAVSDLNLLYQKIIVRNKRVKRVEFFQSDEKKYAQRLLQEAVDGLIENGKNGSEPLCGFNERPLKSLSDILKGKKGRFRQNLLGKRVDYSGRSVIVVGPELKLHQCGLPKEMAVELFQPFLIRSLKNKKKVKTISGAKKLIKEKNPMIWKFLEKIMQNHPILLNRAPTLHRMGFQAFQPKLIDGKAILLHPLVCTGYNADFDGDQMAVHVPLSFDARSEAWSLLWSRNNLLSPATGDPNISPSQDMILGCFFLTNIKSKKNILKKKKIFTVTQILKLYQQNQRAISFFVWFWTEKEIENKNKKEKPLEMQIFNSGFFLKIYSQIVFSFDFKGKKKKNFIRTTVGQLLFNNVFEEYKNQ